MQNNVTYALFNKFCKTYNTIIMFNFRGIGDSEGWPSVTGWNERSDVKAVCKFIGELDNPGKDIVLLGYSAGSAIGCGCIDEVPEMIAFAAIGYPLGWAASLIFGSHYTKAKTTKPKLFIQGDWDQFTSESQLVSWMQDLQGEKEMAIIKGADHFFFDHEDEMVSIIQKWLKNFEK
jgi:alpha/beta superfamily hydrolase